MLQATPYTPRFTNLVALFSHATDLYQSRPLFGVRHDGTWRWVTYGQFAEQVASCRSALDTLGVRRGDRVAVVSSNRLELPVAAFAVLSLGATWVPMYEALRDAEMQFILNDCGATLCFAGPLAGRLRELLPSLRVVSFDDWSTFLADGAKRAVPPVIPEDSDIAYFIYTSGTTAQPKGVKLSHRSVAFNTSALLDTFPLSPEDRTLAFLPWAHVAGAITELLAVISNGASAAICEDPKELLTLLAEVHPTVLVAVPRVWNRIYDVVSKSIESRSKPVRALIRAGLAARGQRGRGSPIGFWARAAAALVGWLVLAKIHAKFGGQLRYALSGAAALSPEVAQFIDNLGIKVYEGYGMSESASVVVANRPGGQRIGSVGKPIEGVRIVLDTDAPGASDGSGEIVIYGDAVMAGYNNLPEETARVVMPDGGLRTGDLGRLDADGFLFITGRVKEIYKLETGKYVSPAPLEEALTLSPYIAQALVHGSNHPHNVALLVADLAALTEWAKPAGLGGLEAAALVEHPKVRALYRSEVDRMSSDWRGFDRIVDFLVISEEFTIAADLLTPTLKVKRRNVMTKWGEKLDALYKRPS
ncbi:MAG: AMP-dependent synthetase/ligase [Myxococcales bacterium]